MPDLSGNLNLRAALAMAKELGADIESVNRTGEVRIKLAGMTVKHNARRKDASRAFMAMLRKAQDEKGDV
jgi:hypothetical protein